MKRLIFIVCFLSFAFGINSESSYELNEDSIEIMILPKQEELAGNESQNGFEQDKSIENADFSDSLQKEYDSFSLSEEDSFEVDAVSGADENEKIDYLHVEIQIPKAKRPKKPDPEKLSAAKEKDKDGEDFDKNVNIIKFGTPSEISDLIKSVTESEDPRYSDELYDLFQTSSSNSIKENILEYFTKQKDPCLEDYAVEIADDPYDIPVSIVEKCFNYLSEVQCKEAGPAFVKILEGGEEKYFNGALSALGKTGSEKEAVYLAEYLKNDDLTVPQKQALMRTLGEMCVLETWDQLSLIAQDEDENNFVRMYAAEAIGKMKKNESIPILEKLYAEGDPNMRQYCIKGFAHYENEERAHRNIIQAIRDDHYKVRIEAIHAAKKQKLTKSIDFLIYRAKNDSENAVKNESYIALAELNEKKANDFLVGQILEKKVSDSAKALICENLVKNGDAGEKEIIELGKKCAEDDKLKKLRAELGKTFIKYPKKAWNEVCILYLQSKDVTTVSQGLSMFKNSKYSDAKDAVLKIANDKKSNLSNKKRARKLLGLPEDDDENSNDKESLKTVDGELEKSKDTASKKIDSKSTGNEK